MIPGHSNGSEILVRLHEARAQLAELLPKLAQVNEAFVNVTRPLATISDLDLEHRQKLATRIRAANREWEEVTNRINDALARLNKHYNVTEQSCD